MCKSIQYASRFLMHINAQDKETAARFRALFVGMRDARKLFRLFKSLNELEKLQALLTKTPANMDELDLLLNIGARLGFFGYWIFDNLQILAQVKMINKQPADFLKPASFFWWLGNVFNFITAVKKLKSIDREVASKGELIAKDPSKKDEFKARFEVLKDQRNAAIRMLLKSCGDLVTSSVGWGLTTKLGLKVNDGHIGFSGLVSAVIATWEAFPARK